jgi:hypothetical protein
MSELSRLDVIKIIATSPGKGVILRGVDLSGVLAYMH